MSVCSFNRLLFTMIRLLKVDLSEFENIREFLGGSNIS